MATVPTPRTWTVGELLTAAKMNTDVRDGLNMAIKPPFCALQSTVATSVPNGGSGANIAFDVEHFDSESMHSTSSNTHRITAQTAGWYHIQGIVGYSFNTSADRHAIITINDNNQHTTSVHASSATSILIPVAGYLFLSVGDWVSLKAFQQSGGSLNTSALACRFEARWVHKGS
jgi:hypothetical protein